MAHFAKVFNGIVEQVIVISNDDAPTEAAGKAFIASIGLDGDWVQTSYNNNFVEGEDRGKYAAVGDIWDGQKFLNPNSGDAQ